MEREVGGGIGMGNTCKPMAVSFQCMTKFTTNKKKKKKKKLMKPNFLLKKKKKYYAHIVAVDLPLFKCMKYTSYTKTLYIFNFVLKIAYLKAFHKTINMLVLLFY